MTINTRVNALDTLKFLAITCVILTHSCLTRKYFYTPVWMYIVYMAVPVFMMISGFVMTASFDRLHPRNIFVWFHPLFFLKKVLRFVIPFLILFGCEMYIRDGKIIPLNKMMSLIIQGGYSGSGSYYISFLFQLVIIFPFLYYLLKMPVKSTGALLVFCCAWELYAKYEQLDSHLYRLLIFRQIFAVWLGMILARFHDKLSPKLVFLAAIIGVLYLAIPQAQVIVYSWRQTGFPCVLLVFGYIKLALKYKESWIMNLKIPVALGQMTYTIFLFQLLWFSFIKKSKITLCPESALRDLIVCFLGGILFHYILFVWPKKILRRALSFKERLDKNLKNNLS